MMKQKILLTSFLSAAMISTYAQTARVQIIHNSPDAAAASVDIYLNGVKTLDNVPFRAATAFLDVPAGVPINVGIAPQNSTTVADTFYNLSTTLTAGAKYIAVANGIESSTGYSPAVPFRVSVYNMGREAATNAANTDVLVVHGSTDAPTVDVRSGVNTLVDDIAFGNFAGYLELPTADYKIRVTTTTGATTVQTYSAPLQTLNLDGEAIVVLASGFLTPANNSNGPAFGLYVALASGGSLIPLPTTDPEALARVQAIHNCADAAADAVDVYLNGDKLLDNFAFRTATPFIDAPAKTALNIGIAPKNSTAVTDTLYNLNVTLDSAGNYILVANGIVSGSGYTPSPDFRLSPFAPARELGTNASNTDVLVMHGSTDAPTVDVRSGGNTLVNDISFGSYSSYLSLPTSNYTIDVTDASGSTVVKSYSAPLQTLGLQGQAITVLASGFLAPANNSNGPAFGLYAALATGGALVPLPAVTSSVANIDGGTTFSVWPNPATDVLHIDGLKGSYNATIYDVTGKMISAVNNSNNSDINISNIGNGVYFIRLENGTNSEVIKFVKQ
ncbi:MAG TPA: DUF4397 domain-containing protein [Flavipsychrobacter sp.]